MVRLRRWFRDRGLATKQFVFLFVVFSVLFYSLALGNLRDAENAVREQVIGDAQIVLDRTNRLLDSYIETIMSILLLVQSSQEALRAGSEYETRKLLADYSKTSAIVRTLYFIREDGTLMSSKQGLTDVFGNPELARLHGELRGQSYALQWSEPYYSPTSGNTVAFVLPVRDASQRIVGMAALEIDLDLLKTRLSEMIGNTDQTFAVLTSSRHIVSIDLMSPLVPYVIESYQKKLAPDFAARLAALSTGVAMLEGADRPVVAVKSASNKLSWSIISLIDEAYFYRNILKLNDNFRQAALLWAVILFVCVWIITRLITQPIRKLALKMDRVRDFEVVQPLYLEGKDEIGLLAQSYNRLLARVQLLIKEIREAEAGKKHYEYQMLQSQIGPHFLYNTLTCISSLARQQKIEQVRETIRSLGGLLHYSFQQAGGFVTLRQEVEALQWYAQIQKVRYGDQFDIVFDVDPRFDACRFLKLTLQPLVENAIYHGIAPKSDPGLIRVIARQRGARLLLFVSDNGVGMTEETKRGLLGRKGPGNPKAFNSIGLVNVQQRIRLHFGEAYGLHIASVSGKGTIIRLTLPLQEAQAGEEEI